MAVLFKGGRETATEDALNNRCKKRQQSRKRCFKADGDLGTAAPSIDIERHRPAAELALGDSVDERPIINSLELKLLHRPKRTESCRLGVSAASTIIVDDRESDAAVYIGLGMMGHVAKLATHQRRIGRDVDRSLNVQGGHGYSQPLGCDTWRANRVLNLNSTTRTSHIVVDELDDVGDDLVAVRLVEDLVPGALVDPFHEGWAFEKTDAVTGPVDRNKLVVGAVDPHHRKRTERAVIVDHVDHGGERGDGWLLERPMPDQFVGDVRCLHRLIA